MTTEHRGFFSRVFAGKQQQDKPNTNETAVANASVLYSGSDYERYNPDDLMGRKGWQIYKKMSHDEQIKAVMKFKRDAITSRDYMFEIDCEKHNLSEEEGDRRKELFEFIIDKLEGSWIDKLNGIMSAGMYGFSMTEKLFTQIEWDGLTWWGIKNLKLKPFDTFKFHEDQYGNITRLTQKISGKTIDLDIDKFIHMVFNPDVDEHYGQSDMREAYRAWFSKDMIIKFRNMYLERHAGGFRWIEPTDRDVQPNSPEYALLQGIMSNINTSTGILMPKGFTIHSDYPTGNVPYADAISDYDTAIARSVLVPNLLGVSPQGAHGSLAQADTQLEAFFWTLEADKLRLEEVLNEQLFRPLGELNFGDDAWPRYKFKPISERKIMEVIKVWKDLVQAGAVKATSSDEHHVRELLEFPNAEEENQQPDQPQPQPNQPQPPNQPTQPDQQSPTDGDEGGDMTTDSTIIGKGLVSISAFSRALKRVDFAVIEKKSDAVVEDYTGQVAGVIGAMTQDLIDKAKAGGELTQDIAQNVQALKPDSKLKRKLNSVMNVMLKDGWKIGTQQATTEIDKAKGKAFSKTFDRERLDMIAEDYFKTTAFTISGNLTDEAVRIIEQEILNGARYGKSWDEVEQGVYTTMAQKGMISTAQARDALGEALNLDNPDARLRTIVRTSTFDAINNARYGYFTDPGMGNYVQAFEYSAILDSRTTQICRHLDDDNEGDHGKDWYEANPQYRPPNHYNCRSILVPVTEQDMSSFVEGPEPTVEPQAGFK